MKKILLTGGTGYIGSHTAAALQAAGFEVILADNLSNSAYDVPHRIAEITGTVPRLYQINIADHDALANIFRENEIDGVIHFAGFKAVGESVRQPILYYRNNLDTLLTLLETMQEFGCKRLIFSSSAAVYGTCNPVPFTEDMPAGSCTNPYGWTKRMIEQILFDAAAADPELSVLLLRYFNPIGAHESGRLGELPSGIPNNLMPYITQVAAGIRDHLTIYGNDYPTRDGTCIRDYVHVMDLAQGHVSACRYGQTRTGCEVFNLGTGKGYSVLETVHAFEAANGVRIPYQIAARRDGDLAEAYADTRKAEAVLGWKAEKTLEDMCRDAWRWQCLCGEK